MKSHNCNCCGKSFLIFQNVKDWTYKDFSLEGSRRLYCGYSCWIKSLEDKESTLRGGSFGLRT